MSNLAHDLLRSRGLRGALACAVLAGCLPAPSDNPVRNECDDSSDCNQGAGEICDVGVCWGDPPAGAFAAILVPPTELQGDLVMTGLAALTLERDGGVHDGGGGSLTFDQGVAMTGRVTMPCPQNLPTCSLRQPLPGQIRWSRPSGFPGGPRLTGSATVASDGTYQLIVTRPRVDAPVTMTVAFTPSQIPFGQYLPSPAMLIAPHQVEVVVTATDVDARTDKIAYDLALDPANLRTVSGRITRPSTAPVEGWQLQAEVVVETGAGARQLVSSLAVTDSEGYFTLRVASDYPVVDVVCSPPSSGGPIGESRPSVRARDVVIADLVGPMREMVVPQLGAPVAVGFDVTGTDGSGGEIAVDGATVVVRLDQALGNGLQLELAAQATTTGGHASLLLFPVMNGTPLQYTVDVLPGPGELDPRLQRPARPLVQRGLRERRSRSLRHVHDRRRADRDRAAAAAVAGRAGARCRRPGGVGRGGGGDPVDRDPVRAVDQRGAAGAQPREHPGRDQRQR